MINLIKYGWNEYWCEIFTEKTRGEMQPARVLAANIDYLFIVTSLNKEFNLRRLERYLIRSWESNFEPIIVLSKQDLSVDYANKIIEVQNIAMGVPIISTSAKLGIGLQELENLLIKGKTGVFVGKGWNNYRYSWA